MVASDQISRSVVSDSPGNSVHSPQPSTINLNAVIFVFKVGACSNTIDTLRNNLSRTNFRFPSA